VLDLGGEKFAPGNVFIDTLKVFSFPVSDYFGIYFCILNGAMLVFSPRDEFIRNFFQVQVTE
jgi:hypothetical protein